MANPSTPATAIGVVNKKALMPLENQPNISRAMVENAEFNKGIMWVNQIAKDGCAQGEGNIADLIQAKTGVKTYDYSCPGATMYTPGYMINFNSKVDEAIASGALNRSTSFVPVQLGYNDIYLNYQRRVDEKAQLFKQAVDQGIRKIKKAAPNAKILLITYPAQDDPATGRNCSVHVDVFGQKVHIGVPVPPLSAGVRDTYGFLKSAAARNNVGFLDLEAPTRNMHTCSNDESRILAGIIDYRNDYNLPVHLTNRGLDVVSTLIVDQYR